MPEEVLADPKRWVDELEVGQGPLDAESDLEKLKAALQKKTVLLELGCAVGNGLIPMLRANPDLFGLGCDLSAEAVRLLRDKEEYRCGRCLAFPCDITKGPQEQPTSEHRSLEETRCPRRLWTLPRCSSCSVPSTPHSTRPPWSASSEG
ncbi:unnamed protein product [Effrenium voratum]|nr:unnamed protein product [Effrenium voratum]